MIAMVFIMIKFKVIGLVSLRDPHKLNQSKYIQSIQVYFSKKK
jgi:hypothetical protein